MAVDLLRTRLPAEEARPLKRRRLEWDFSDSASSARRTFVHEASPSQPFRDLLNIQDPEKESLDFRRSGKPAHKAVKTQHKDDKDGRFTFTLGESLSSRYKIIRKMGEGTFGQVLECWDRDAHEAVAIKVIRSVKKYRDAAMTEIDVLFKIGKDHIGARGCVQIRRWFEHENHICIVFEKLGPSLFDFLRANKYRPFSVNLVREFGRQLLESLAYIHSVKYIHTDLKPENVLLVSSEYTKVFDPKSISRKSTELKRVPRSARIKLIDFGSTTSYRERSSSIVSTRHYRAPEVILGLGWSYPCDIWSIGCILVELCTGELLFETHENIEHLAMMERVLGPIPPHLIRHSTGEAEKYFRHKRRLNWPEGASSSQSIRAVQKLLRLDDLVANHVDSYASSLIDLLRQLLNFDPAERPSAKEALRHPFFLAPDRR